jgi:hypothetical protein
MSIDQLAAHNRADRLRVLDGAIADQRRGIEVRRANGAHSVQAHEANLARLLAKRDALAGAA